MCGVPREQCEGFESRDRNNSDDSPPAPQEVEDRYITEWLSDDRWFED